MQLRAMDGARVVQVCCARDSGSVERLVEPQRVHGAGFANAKAVT